MEGFKGLCFANGAVTQQKFTKGDTKVVINRKEDENFIYSEYDHKETVVEVDDKKNIFCKEVKTVYEIKMEKIKNENKLGVLIVGIGGNNATTMLGGICANSNNITYCDRYGMKKANYLGSVFLSSNVRIGYSPKINEHIYAPIYKLVEIFNPENIVFGGWDLNKMNLKDTFVRNKVFETYILEKIKNKLNYVPMESVYFNGNHISYNQKKRVNNILKGKNKLEILEKVREQIRNFKKVNNLKKLIVLWSANTERNTSFIKDVNDNFQNILLACKNNHPSISPSIIYALASLLENAPFINSSPQNTLVDAVTELACHKGVFVVGNDLKTGQTKIKNLLLDFYFNTGLKPRSVVSYNHLGNNDGKNLSSALQFESKRVSKSNLIADYVKANENMYEDVEEITTNEEAFSNVDSLNEQMFNEKEKEESNYYLEDEIVEKQKVNSEIVIKYVPYVGDDKKALDEYISELFMNGRNTIALYNVCQDSLLAAPILIDLILLLELSERVYFKRKQGNATEEKNTSCANNVYGKETLMDELEEEEVIKVGDYTLKHTQKKMKNSEFTKFASILAVSSVFCKSPLNSEKYKTRHSFFSQLESLINMIRIVANLPIDEQLDVNHLLRA